MNFTNFFFKKVSYQLLEQIFRVLINLAVFYYVSRTLDYDQLAVFNISLMLFGLLGAFQTFGLTNTILVELKNNTYSNNSILSNAFIINFIGNILIIAIGSIILLFFKNQNYPYLGLVILICYSFKFNDLIKSIYVAFEKHRVNAIIEIINTIVFGCLKIYFLISLNFVGFLITVILENILILIISIIHLYLNKYRFINIDFKIIISLLRGSGVFFISSIIIGLYSKLDQLILAYWINPKEISEFYVGIKINDSTIMLMGVIISSFYPVLYDLYEKGKEDLLLKMKYYFKRIYILILVYFILNLIFAKSIFNLLFEDKFESAYWISIIHSPIVLFSFLGAVSDKYSAICGDKKFIYNKYLITLLISLLLNLTLTPSFGIKGYITSLMIANLYQGLISDFFSNERRGLFYTKILRWIH